MKLRYDRMLLETLQINGYLCHHVWPKVSRLRKITTSVQYQTSGCNLGFHRWKLKSALFALKLVSNKERLLLGPKYTVIISLLAKLHRRPFASTYKLQPPISLSMAFQIMKAARPVRKPRSEVLMVV